MTALFYLSPAMQRKAVRRGGLPLPSKFALLKTNIFLRWFEKRTSARLSPREGDVLENCIRIRID